MSEQKNLCEPESWLGASYSDGVVWRETEGRALHQSDFTAAGVLALKAQVETQRLVILDLIKDVEQLERTVDKLLLASREGE
jgi:hypothetical protein